MKKLFEKVGLNINNMEIEKPYNIIDKNIRILSYDENIKQNKYKQIKKLVYKGNFEVWEVREKKTEKLLLKGKNNHKIFDTIKNDFVFLDQSRSGKAFQKNGKEIEYYTINTHKIEPIVDLEVEDKTYFSNEILSHNTVLHFYLSEAIDDWKKIKDFIKKVMYNTKLPSITITPTFSHCQIHGYIKGDTKSICPKCREEAINGYQTKLNELEEKKQKILEEVKLEENRESITN
jgi:hypothetical protein